MNIFEIKNLSVYYENIQAVRNISMTIPEYKITALIGPSGCGKSTFLRALNRMNDLIPNCKTTGEVLFQGINIYKPDIDVIELRKRIGMVFQKPNPFPFSIFDNVAYGLRIRGIKNKEIIEERVEESLKRAALWDEVKDRLKKSAFQLSGGQQQRLCIARALVTRPKVLLFDEPCASLDPISTSKIEDLLQKLKKEITIIIVTHNMQQAARISDFTGFILNGELIEYNDTNSIFTKPRDKRTEDYISGKFG